LHLPVAILGKSGSESHLLLAAAFIGYGILLALNVGILPGHYLMVTFPLEWLWWTFIFKNAFSAHAMRWMLVGLWACQLILSIGYLGYIHVNQGAKTGDYGTGYQNQNPFSHPAKIKGIQMRIAAWKTQWAFSSSLSKIEKTVPSLTTRFNLS
jgi:hypothetical protein